MSNEIESMWRKDFLSVINYRGTAHCTNGQYADNRLHQKWIGYKAGRKHSETREQALVNTLVQRTEFFDQRIAELSELVTGFVDWFNDPGTKREPRDLLGKATAILGDR